MVRSAAAFAAVLFVPGFLLAQEAPRNHTVVDGDTLWDLAASFYSNPFDWRRIWEANRGSVDNPNLILPGQVLVIPGVEGTVTDVMVETTPGMGPEPIPPRVDPEHTIFRRQAQMGGVVAGGANPNYVAVARDRVYAAPWLIGLEAEPVNWGTIDVFADPSRSSTTPRGYDQVILDATGPASRVGTELLTYRVSRTLDGVGRVVTPTGVLTVTATSPDGPIAVVTREYDRMSLGDFIGPLPDYPIAPGRRAEVVSRGAEAMVVGFAGMASLHNLGAMAFLDVGTDQGVGIGDEFEYWSPDTGGNIAGGRLQVVGVTPRIATARIVEIDNPVFEQGVIVRLARKMMR